MKNILFVLFVSLFAAVANANQYVSAECGDGRISVYYGATDPELMGLGIRIHFSSSEISNEVVEDILQTSYFGTYSASDTGNYDADSTTDQFIFMSWVDWMPPPAWPGVYATKLFHIDHDGDAGTVSFSLVSGAANHGFSSTGC